MTARRPTRVYVTVTLDVASDWYDDLDPDRPQDAVASIVDDVLDRHLHGPFTVVHVEASEVL